MHTQTDFMSTVLPTYLNFLELEGRFPLDVPAKELLEKVIELDIAEKDVLLAWANATRKENPSMLSDVNGGYVKLLPLQKIYLQGLLKDFKKDG